MFENTPIIIYLICLLVLVGAGVFTSQKASKSVRDLLIWAGVILVLVLGYRIYEKISFSPVELENGNYAIRIPYDRQYGGYRLDFTANATKLSGIIDTGATSIIMSYDDAKKSGINVENLRFTIPFGTANGTTHGAAAELDRLAVEDIVFNEVPIYVAQDGDLETTLLGMPFLRRAKSFSSNSDVMIIEF